MPSSEELKAALNRVAAKYRSNSIERNYLNGMALRPGVLNQIITELTSITCPQCGGVSYNQDDIKHRYCGNCHRFHADMRLPR